MDLRLNLGRSVVNHLCIPANDAPRAGYARESDGAGTEGGQDVPGGTPRAAEPADPRVGHARPEAAERAGGARADLGDGAGELECTACVLRRRRRAGREGGVGRPAR